MTPRTVGRTRNQPPGPGVSSDSGIGFVAASEDHEHQLWEPWVDHPTSLDVVQYSLSPPYIMWFVSHASTPANPIFSNNPYPPQYRVALYANSGFMVFEPSGNVNMFDWDLATTAGLVGPIYLYDSVYRYDS